MPRDMFGSVTDPPIHVGTRSKYSVPLALLAHLAVLVPLIVIPILATDILPDPPTTIVMVNELPIPEPPPVARRPSDPRPQPRANPDAAPVVMPDRIAPEADPIVSFEDDVPGIDIVDGTTGFSTVLPAPPPAPPAAPQAVRPGGDIRPPTKVHDVAPVYPAIAQVAGVQGMVIVEALIDIDGRVQQARVLRSVPLLDQAALAAVQQWRYTPTRLNGQPVPVLMTVTVQFVLKR